MDAFASILAKEMQKKGAAANVSTKTSAATADSSNSKFLKRSELEKKRQEEYRAEQKRLEEERAEKAAKKRKLEEEAAEARERTMEKRQRLREEKERARKEKEEQEEDERRRKLAAKSRDKNCQENGTEGTQTSGAEAEQLDEETAIKRLRELEQPIRLFGESHAQRLRRLRRLTEAKSRQDSSPTPARMSSPPPLSGKDILIDQADVTKNPALVYRQLHAWFTLVVSEWEKALAERPVSIRESYQGKQATNAMKQAIDYIQPLFRHLKRKDLDDDIFTRVVEIVVEAQARRYVKANDVYLRLSIGNAAWPIGVTMVGIHERSAREKLHEKGKSAHIMSDEVTRKYLQSIKRCLNFAQTRWPPEDPMQLMG